MVIAVFGATGMVGKEVVKFALAQENDVQAFGRNVETLIDPDIEIENLVAIKGYVFDETDVYNAVKGSDIIISVLGGGFDGEDKTRSIGLKNIIAQMQKAAVKRIVALGGLGVLNADENTYLLDTPNYPKIYLPVGKEHLQAYLYLKDSNLDWTYICAPNIKSAEPTNIIHTKADYVPDINNNSITSADLALFMLNEAIANKFVKKRVGISN